MKTKDLLSLNNLDRSGIESILELAGKIKKEPKQYLQVLSGKTIGLVFQKPSTRTRLSFEVGMFQLGGNAVYLGAEDIRLGIREDLRDLARTLSRYLDGIVARTYAHEDVENLAKHSSIPVINGLSNSYHPCQALSDLFTIKERFSSLDSLVVSYVGDGNNVLHSLIQICALMGVSLKIATPKGYEADQEVLRWAMSRSSKINAGHDPRKAVEGADVVYTDVWTSMGQEKEAKKRRKIFREFQVNPQLTALAKPKHVVMHCLPAHRGEEIADEVLDGGHSVVFDQTENKLHLHKAILSLWLENSVQRSAVSVR